MDMGEDEYGGGPRVKRTRQVHPRSDLSQAPWSTILSKKGLKCHDSREARDFCRRFRIPYKFFLELAKLAKQVVLIGCNGRGSEADHTSEAEDL